MVRRCCHLRTVPGPSAEPCRAESIYLNPFTHLEYSMARKVISTSAVRGAIHTPQASPYLPVTHQQISAAVLAERCVSSQRPGVVCNLESSK